jgi:hypothetical protein
MHDAEQPERVGDEGEQEGLDRLLDKWTLGMYILTRYRPTVGLMNGERLG